MKQILGHLSAIISELEKKKKAFEKRPLPPVGEQRRKHLSAHRNYGNLKDDIQQLIDCYTEELKYTS